MKMKHALKHIQIYVLECNIISNKMKYQQNESETWQCKNI